MTSREDVRKMMIKENIDDLKKVKQYLKERPMSNMMEVHLKTGVPVQQIHSFIRYGVLKIKAAKAG
jgi:fructose/tagatose bisphosphate aldolase